MAIFVAALGILNGVVHTYGYFKQREEKELRGSLASGFYTGIFLFFCGVLVIILL